MNDYDQIMKPIKFSLTVVGWNVLHENWKPSLSSFISFFTISNLVYDSIIFMAQTNDVYQFVECAGVLGSLFPIIPKMMVLYVKRTEIFNLVKTIQVQTRKVNKLEGELNVEYTKRFIMGTKILYLLFLLAVTIFYVTPLFDSKSKRLPLFDHIPFLPYDRTPYYEMNYIYQLYTFTVGTNSMAGIDLFACYHIYYICNRIEVLTKMIDFWNDQIEKGSKTSRVQSDIFSSIVQQHALIKDTMVCIERVFSPMILAVLISNSFSICMCLMRLIEDPFSKVIFHGMVVTSQTFMYCYIGNLLTVKNDRLLRQIQQIDYSRLNISDQKSYGLLVQHALKPIEIRAIFVTVNLELFQQIVNRAYSMFNIMKNVIQ